MRTSEHRCISGVGHVELGLFEDASGVTLTIYDPQGCVTDYVILNNQAVQDITNQLQAYLNETSESTSA